MVQVRPASVDDVDLLVRALALAADWRPEALVRTPAEVLADPVLAGYVAGWPGPRERGVVAELDGAAVGAAWWRFLPGGYGFVRADVPEVSVGVLPEHRGRGVGTELLRAMGTAAEADGLPGLSLSVERDNPAVRLYRRLGFVEVSGGEGALTMLRQGVVA